MVVSQMQLIGFRVRTELASEVRNRGRTEKEVRKQRAAAKRQPGSQQKARHSLFLCFMSILRETGVFLKPYLVEGEVLLLSVAEKLHYCWKNLRIEHWNTAGSSYKFCIKMAMQGEI